MSKKLLALCMIVSLSAVSLVQAQDNGSIGMYLDTAGTQCDGSTNGTPLNGSIWVNLAGATAGGITGAEFRVDPNNRTDYLYVANGNPAANVVLGDPFDFGSGTNIAFADCQDGIATGGRVQLFTVQIFENGTPEQNNWLTLRQHFTPSNETFRCPLVTLCDAPAYTKICVGPEDSDHWRAVVNPEIGVTGDCQPVAVEQDTWTSIKGMYRD